MLVTLQGEVGGPGQKGSKGDKGELVSLFLSLSLSFNEVLCHRFIQISEFYYNSC